MIVYCGSKFCKHNNDGYCENHYATGTEAITMSETLGGQMVCDDQDDWEPICETCKNWDGIKNQCRINGQKDIDCWENPFDRD